MNDLIKTELAEEIKPYLRNLLKLTRRLIPSKVRKFLIYSYLLISLITFVVGGVGIKLGVVNFNFQHLQNANILDSSIQQIGDNNTLVLSEKTQCLSQYCSDFEFEDWYNIGKFSLVQEKPLILKSPNSPQLPGATMFYKGHKARNFIAKIFITPLATRSANLVLAYGSLYRCILGDSDYKIITCQINQTFPRIPEEWGYFDKEGIIHGKAKHYQTRSFEPEKELDLRFEQREDGRDTIISIKINDQVPAEWILPKKFQDIVKLDDIGLGLITTRYDDVQAIFKHFELDPKL